MQKVISYIPQFNLIIRGGGGGIKQKEGKKEKEPIDMTTSPKNLWTTVW